MRNRVRLPLIAHTAVCSLLGIAFIGYAARHLGLTGTIGPARPFHTTNEYVGGITNSPEASERLVDLLALLPEKTPIAVVYRGSEVLESFTAFGVTYFAWPREVHAFPLRGDNAESQLKAALTEKDVSGIFFCGVPPPQSPGLVRIGDGLVFVPRTEP